MKILFVCLGNICRSPMAEMIFKDLVHKRGLDQYFLISSAGISDEEKGNDIYPLAKRKLLEKGITVEKRRARKITQDDMRNYDFIIVMEKYQGDKILKDYFVKEKLKVRCLNEKDIDDPWYSGNFEEAFQDILTGCEKLLKELEKKL